MILGAAALRGEAESLSAARALAHAEDHTEGFRKSAAYQDWKKLLHHFYDPFPTVEHYEGIAP